MTAVTWDERLISRERAANLAGMWEATLDHQGEGGSFLRCAQCKGNMLKLPGPGHLLSVDGIISAVVRHMTMTHNYSLSGAPSDPV